MRSMLKTLVFGTVLLAAVCLAAPLALPPDYSAMPNLSGMENRIRESKVKLDEAIDLAEKEVNGVAKSASLNLTSPPTINVYVYGNGKGYTIVIDALSGKVLSNNEAPPLPGDPVTNEPQTTESGLVYYDLKEGTGAQPSGPAAQVTVHYTGWLNDGKKFDSSHDHPGGKPATFPLGGVIRGWTEGVGTMKVGGKRKFIIHSDLAYGPGGRPSIPPKATLIFDVELLDVTQPPAAPPTTPMPATQPR